MATFLDIGLLSFLDVIFVFLFIWAVIFAILQKTKALGPSVGINAIVSIAIAFLALLSRTIVEVVKFSIPWFGITIIFLVLMILLYQVFGVKDPSAALKDKTVQWAIFAVGMLIIGAAFASIFGEELLAQSVAQGEETVAGEARVATSDYKQNIMATIFHPKILGVMMLFIVAIFAIIFLTGSS